MNHKSKRLKYLIRTILYVFLIPGFTVSVQAQSTESTEICGIVQDEAGSPVHLVHVKIQNAGAGDVTNEEGKFCVTHDTTGTFLLQISSVGYETVQQEVDAGTGDKKEVEITLSRRDKELEEIAVTAGAYTTGEEEKMTMSPIEVVTTPGASADIFQTFQSLPGITSIDEGSGMYVRGGDVTEVAFHLDQAPVEHPYRYETPTGGVFGTIPPFLVSETFFSTGGFSAKYGDALSAVLSMESQDRPQVASANLNVGLAAQSAGADLPFGDSFGLRFSGNRSSTEYMFRLNNLEDEFDEAPHSSDGNLSMIYEPDEQNQIKFFNYLSENRVGVPVDEPSFSDVYAGEEQNRLHNLQWSSVFGDWRKQTSLSFNRFKSEREFGGLEINTFDRTWNFRSDWERYLTDNLMLNFGGEWHQKSNQFSGSVPDQDQILDPSSRFAELEETFGVTRFGGYAEAEAELISRLTAVTGLRTDYRPDSEEVVVDPRFRVSYDLNPLSFSFATGRYHQFPEPFTYNEETGNPDIEAQQAWHYIGSAEYRRDLLQFRTEAYYKNYRDLVIEDENLNYSNRGYGDAYGVDLFLKYSEYLRTPFNGWISYSFLRSNRFQPARSADGYRFETAPSDFDITHSLNIVGKMQVISNLSLGAAWRYSTGRPYTPISDAIPDQQHDFYYPIEGPVNSKRLPDFQRLDVNLSYFMPLTSNLSVVLYGSISNVLDRNNVMDYTYNRDYSEREPVYSNYGRFMYFGFTMERQF